MQMDKQNMLWIWSLFTGLLFFGGMFPLIRTLSNMIIVVLFTFLLCMIPLWMPKKLLECGK